MCVKLSIGQTINLTKRNPGLKTLTLTFSGNIFENRFDLDISVLLLKDGNKCLHNSDLVFYGNRTHSSGSVVLVECTNNKKIEINLSEVPVPRIILACSVYIKDLNYDFSSVRSITTELRDTESQHNLAQYVFFSDSESVKGVIIGELFKYENEWYYKALGEDYKDGLPDICNKYGITVS